MKKADYPRSKEALENYVSKKAVTVKSKGKLQDIERYIHLFLDHVGQDLTKVEEKHITDFLGSLDYSTATLNVVKVYLKNFIKWNYPNWSADFRNLEEICKSREVEQTYAPKEMLTKEDISKLVKEENSPFWKTFILLLFYGGFRPVEVSTLKWSNVTYSKGGGAYIDILSGKTKKRFIKYIPEDTVFYLKRLEKKKSSQWVFPSPIKENTHIGRKAFYQRLVKLSPRALGKKINPYILRHSVGTLLYTNDNLKDSDVAQQMGHSVDMKKVYTKLDETKLKEKARKMWIAAEELPPEAKEDFMRRLEEIEKFMGRIDNLESQLAEMRKENERFKK